MQILTKKQSQNCIQNKGSVRISAPNNNFKIQNIVNIEPLLKPQNVNNKHAFWAKM
jgi:hypothetical protein